MTDKNELSRRQRQQYNDTARDLAAVLRTPEGSRLIRWMLDRCGVFLSSQSDTFDPGRREMGIELIRVMDAIGPHAFPKLMQQAANEKVEYLSTQKNKGTEHDD